MNWEEIRPAPHHIQGGVHLMVHPNPELVALARQLPRPAFGSSRNRPLLVELSRRVLAADLGRHDGQFTCRTAEELGVQVDAGSPGERLHAAFAEAFPMLGLRGGWGAVCREVLQHALRFVAEAIRHHVRPAGILSKSNGGQDAVIRAAQAQGLQVQNCTDVGNAFRLAWQEYKGGWVEACRVALGEPSPRVDSLTPKQQRLLDLCRQHVHDLPCAGETREMRLVDWERKFLNDAAAQGFSGDPTRMAEILARNFAYAASCRSLSRAVELVSEVNSREQVDGLLPSSASALDALFEGKMFTTRKLTAIYEWPVKAPLTGYAAAHAEMLGVTPEQYRAARSKLPTRRRRRMAYGLRTRLLNCDGVEQMKPKLDVDLFLSRDCPRGKGVGRDLPYEPEEP